MSWLLNPATDFRLTFTLGCLGWLCTCIKRTPLHHRSWWLLDDVFSTTWGFCVIELCVFIINIRQPLGGSTSARQLWCRSIQFTTSFSFWWWGWYTKFMIRIWARHRVILPTARVINTHLCVIMTTCDLFTLIVSYFNVTLGSCHWRIESILFIWIPGFAEDQSLTGILTLSSACSWTETADRWSVGRARYWF